MDAEACNRVVVANLRLIRAIAFRMRLPGHEPDDLAQAAAAGLLSRLRRHDEVPPPSVLAKMARASVADYVRSVGGGCVRFTRGELDGFRRRGESIPHGVSPELATEQVCAGAGHVVEDRDELDAAMRSMPKRMARVLRLCFGLGGARPMRMAEVAKVLRISEARVSQIRKEALALARDAVGAAAGS